MANYTQELREITNDLAINIFDFTYVKLPEKDYTVLEQAFINRYLYREIGSETVERFKQFLKTMWLERIEYYNKLWKVALTELNILSTSKVNNTLTTDTTNDNENIFNDTPTSSLGNGTDYATNITTDKQTLHSSNVADNTGYSGITEIELVEIYNANLRDLDTQFLNEFDVLFMGVF